MQVRPRYVRHRDYDRLRHSKRFKGWLEAQATRLGKTAEEVFDMLKDGETFETIQGLPTPPVAVAPANTVAPAITGTAQVGQTLTVSNGTWTGTPAPTFARQWKKGGANIASATGATYVPVVGDVGAVITCTVTATNSAGNASATSAGTDAVIAA